MRVTLPEEILLLALRADSGEIDPGVKNNFPLGTQYKYAIGGAALAELMLRGKVAEDGDSRRPELHVVDAQPLGDPLLDKALQDIAEAPGAKPLRDWIVHVAGYSGLLHRVAASLVARGVVSLEEDRVFLVFPRTRYPERDPGPETELIDRLERTIFSDTDDVDPRTVILLSLAHCGGLLDIPFTRAELRARSDRIEAVIRGEVLGTAATAANQRAVTISLLVFGAIGLAN